MGSYSVEVQIDPAYADCVAEAPLARIVQVVLAQEQQPDDAEVTLVITDDAHMRALNRTYRDVDSTTDVLAFPAREGSDFVTPDELAPYLGDVVVAYPTALAQANEQRHSIDQELALLIVHGCLHLLGYDHATEEEQQRMGACQDVLLRLLS